MIENNFDHKIMCESMNINAILNLRTGSCSVSEISVLNICGGKNDVFTKSVIEWLVKTKKIDNINLLLCGAQKNIDPILRALKKPDTTDCISTDKNKLMNGAKLFVRHQNNLPLQAQWRILQPEIMVVGLHNLGERWCLKNAPFEILFPCNLHDQYTEDADDARQDSSGDDDSNDDEQESNNRKRQKVTIENVALEQSGRPTMFRTEICRRIILMHLLSLVAENRPKIVFIQNITQPSRQSERRRKEEQTWSQTIAIIDRWCAECAYRMRPMGLELKEEQNDDFPSYDVWCNGVFLERIDNTSNHSQLHHGMNLCENSKNINGVKDATKWIFYEQQESVENLQETFHLETSFFSENAQKPLARKSNAKHQQSKKRKKSVTLSLDYDFPYFYAKALANYAVAQTVAMLE